jgi:hypothetical protein
LPLRQYAADSGATKDQILTDHISTSAADNASKHDKFSSYEARISSRKCPYGVGRTPVHFYALSLRHFEQSLESYPRYPANNGSFDPYLASKHWERVGTQRRLTATDIVVHVSVEMGEVGARGQD